MSHDWQENFVVVGYGGYRETVASRIKQKGPGCTLLGTYLGAVLVTERASMKQTRNGMAIEFVPSQARMVSRIKICVAVVSLHDGLSEVEYVAFMYTEYGI